MTDAEKKLILDELKQIHAEAAEALKRDNKSVLDQALADYDKKMSEAQAKIDGDIADLKTAVLTGGSGGADHAADRKMFADFVRTGRVENRTGNTVDDPSGGYLVPEPQVEEILKLATGGNPMRELATVKTISGQYYPWLVRTGRGAAAKTGELATRTNTNTPLYAEQRVNVYEMYSQPAVTQTLLDDAAFDVVGEINEAMGEEYGELENSWFFNGSGSGEAQGLLTVPTVADASWEYGKIGFVNSGAAAAVTADGCIALQDALDDRYSANATWLMKKSTFTALRKLKTGANGANMYLLWTPELVNGRLENHFMGSPVRKCSEMAAVGAGNMAIAYGDIRQAYLIVDRTGINVLRDPYTDSPRVIFKSSRRVGGGVRNFEAVKFLKIAE